jgi:hypothetical protein
MRGALGSKWVAIPLWRRALSLIEVTDAPNARLLLFAASAQGRFWPD